MAQVLSFSEVSEKGTENIPEEDIVGFECDECGHTWNSRKHPADMKKPTCTNVNCRSQDEEKVLVHVDTAETPEKDGESVDSDEYEEETTQSGGSATGEQEAMGAEDEIDFNDLFATDTEVSEGINFMEMGPGDFVRWFFKDDLEEITVKSVDLLARKCRRSNSIPSKEKMAELLDQLPSDVANNRQIAWISGDYWSRAKEYLSQRLGYDSSEIEAQIRQRDRDPGWIELGTRNPPDHQTSGSMMMEPNQQQPGTAGNMRMNPQQNQQQQQKPPLEPSDTMTLQPNQNSPQPIQGQPQNTAQPYLQELRKQQEQMMNLFKEMQMRNQGNGHQDPTDNLKQLVEMKNVLDELSENKDDLPDEYVAVVQQLQQEINNINERIASDGIESSGGDPMANVIAQLAMQGDVDTDTIATIASSFGASADPEVKKMEIEKEIAEVKAQNQRKMINEAIDGLGSAGGNLLVSLLNGVSGEGMQENIQQEMNQQERQRPQGSPQRQRHTREQSEEFEVVEEGEVEEEAVVEPSPDDEITVAEEEAE